MYSGPLLFRSQVFSLSLPLLFTHQELAWLRPCGGAQEILDEFHLFALVSGIDARFTRMASHSSLPLRPIAAAPPLPARRPGTPPWFVRTYRDIPILSFIPGAFLWSETMHRSTYNQGAAAAGTTGGRRSGTKGSFASGDALRFGFLPRSRRLSFAEDSATPLSKQTPSATPASVQPPPL